MQGVRPGFRLIVAGLMMACAALAASAQAHGDHSGHGGQAKAAKMSELGTGAAFDRDGKLWIAYKDGPYVAVRASSDDGRSFGPAQHVNGTPEAVAADHESGPRSPPGATARSSSPGPSRCPSRGPALSALRAPLMAASPLPNR